jgi:hypothetical protein
MKIEQKTARKNLRSLCHRKGSQQQAARGTHSGEYRPSNLKFSILNLQFSMLFAFMACFSANGAEGTANASVTFNKDIAPIVFKNCSSCHHTGEVAPFELLSFDDVRRRGKQIARVTGKRVMPPWKAEPGYGEFHDARRLSDEQIALFQKWLDAGMPEGAAADLPPAPKYKDGWQLGEPDVVLKMPEPYTVPADGRDVYRCFVMPIDCPEDKYVSAVEFRPSNRKVVHHALFFLDSNGAARRKDAADPGPGYKSFGGPGILPTGGLGGWAPGAFPRALPEGIGQKVKKGSDFVLQLHLHPSGKPEEEQSSIGLYFTKKPPEKIMTSVPLRSRNIDIPPGEKAYKVKAEFTTPIDIQIVGITPHAHLVCKEMKGKAFLPDGTMKPLIWIKDWDFNWQDQYLYQTPLKIPAGTRLELDFTYDNSSDNVRNPNSPPKRVTFGEQTADEMAILFLQVVGENQRELPKLRQALGQQMLKGLFGEGAGALDAKKLEMLKDMASGFDKNGDGVLSEEEKAEAVKQLRARAKE